MHGCYFCVTFSITGSASEVCPMLRDLLHLGIISDRQISPAFNNAEPSWSLGVQHRSGCNERTYSSAWDHHLKILVASIFRSVPFQTRPDPNVGASIAGTLYGKWDLDCLQHWRHGMRLDCLEWDVLRRTPPNFCFRKPQAESNPVH